ncbi:MAG: hypothetical protein HQ542_10650 [Bacteroidia bacterium]|nr:hypothetical protein [Bacteroidia bacterium]
MFRNDYGTIYAIHYVDTISKAVNEGRWKEADRDLEKFLNRYEPGWITNMKLPHRCNDKNELETINFFSWLHNIRFQILSNAGETGAAKREATISERLKKAAKL